MSVGNSDIFFELADLQGQVTTNTSEITSLQGNVSTNTSGITSLQGDVSTNTSGITSLQGDVSTNTSGITSLQGDVSTNTSSINSLQNPGFMSWLPTTGTSHTMTSSNTPLAIWDSPYLADSSNMANATTWTVPSAGLWEINATFNYQCSAQLSTMAFLLVVNGTVKKSFYQLYYTNNTNDTATCSCPGIFLNLSQGDSVNWDFVGVSNFTSGSSSIYIGDNTATWWSAINHGGATPS